MNGRFANLFTFVLGALTVRLALSGEYLNYVRASMFPWLVLSGGFLGLLGLAGWLRSLASEHRGSHSCEAGHSHALSRAAWLLLLPLVAATLSQPAPLGSFAASRQSSRLPRPARTSTLAQETIRLQTTPAPATEVAGVPIPSTSSSTQEMSLLDFLEITYYDETKALAGVPLAITGFVMPADKPGEFLLSRFMISCCAADAQLLQAGVTEVQGAVPAEGSWVTVAGSWDPQSAGENGADGFPLPKLKAQTVDPVAQPENPYLSLAQ